MKVEVVDKALVNYESIKYMFDNCLSNEEIINLIEVIDENTELKNTDLTLKNKINYYIVLNGNTRVSWRLRLDQLGITKVGSLTGYFKSFYRAFTKNPTTYVIPLYGVFSFYHPEYAGFSKRVFRLDFTDWSFSKHKDTGLLVPLHSFYEPNNLTLNLITWFKRQRNTLFTYGDFCLTNFTEDRFLPKSSLPSGEVDFDTNNYKFFITDDVITVAKYLYPQWDGFYNNEKPDLEISQEGLFQNIKSSFTNCNNSITYSEKALLRLIYALQDTVLDELLKYQTGKKIEIHDDLIKLRNKTQLARYIRKIVIPNSKGLGKRRLSNIFRDIDQLDYIDNNDPSFILMLLIRTLKDIAIEIASDNRDKPFSDIEKEILSISTVEDLSKFIHIYLQELDRTLPILPIEEIIETIYKSIALP